VQRLPAALRPKPRRHGCVVRFDAEGTVLETWQAPGGSYVMTTGAAVGPDGSTLVTSLTEPDLGFMR
jgi:streptogramin lyase